MSEKVSKLLFLKNTHLHSSASMVSYRFLSFSPCSSISSPYAPFRKHEEMLQPTSCSQSQHGKVESCPPSPRWGHSFGFLSSTDFNQTYKNLIITDISALLSNSVEKSNHTRRGLTGKANDYVKPHFCTSAA